MTSVGITVPSILSVTPSSITSSGTFAITTAVAPTGTGAIVLATSPTLVTPTIGAASGTSLNLSGLTASRLLLTDASKNLTSLTSAGSDGNVLTVVAGSPTWAAPATSGTVTSVGLTVPSILSVAGSPITSSGTLSITTAVTPTGTGAIVLDTAPTINTPTITGVITVNHQSAGSSSSFLYSSMAAGNDIGIWLGKATTTKNSIRLVYHHVADSSNSNFFSFDFNGYSNLITGTAAGLITINGTLNVTSLTASYSVHTDGSKNLVSVQNSGTGLNLLQTSPTLITPDIGAASGTSLNLSGLTASYSVHTDGSKNLVSVQNSGTGLNLLQTSPAMITPNIGSATGTTLDTTGNITVGPSAIATLNRIITVQNTTTANIGLGIVGSAGTYSTTAVQGDGVLRAQTGNLILQSGTGTSAIRITTSNNVEVRNNLNVASLTVTGVTQLGGNLNFKVYTTSGTTNASVGSNVVVALPSGVTKSNVVSMSGVVEFSTFSIAASAFSSGVNYWYFYINGSNVEVYTGGSSVANVGFRLIFITNS